MKLKDKVAVVTSGNSGYRPNDRPTLQARGSARGHTGPEQRNARPSGDPTRRRSHCCPGSPFTSFFWRRRIPPTGWGPSFRSTED